MQYHCSVGLLRAANAMPSNHRGRIGTYDLQNSATNIATVCRTFTEIVAPSLVVWNADTNILSFGIVKEVVWTRF